MFAVAANGGRPALVFEEVDGAIQGACSLYAARSADGSLVKSRACASKRETVEFRKLVRRCSRLS